jgi:predicted metal-dependent enzyme (double-stranded beta helix superfamily)
MGDDQSVAGDYVLDAPRMRQFIEMVNSIRASAEDPHEILSAIRPHFAELLTDQAWLPKRYQEPFGGSGMGSGIGMWLLYRATDGSLAFSSLVVPPGQQTPVHDHLAWGLVGLYRGAQDEDVFIRRDDGGQADHAELSLTQQHHLQPGDFYDLLPENDIHRVRTTSDVTSVSLHLLGNDNGCIWRHRYHPEESRVEPFRSGYVNIDCQEISGAGERGEA